MPKAMPGIIDTPLWGSSRYVDGKAVATFAKTPKRNADRTDASRTIAPSVVAEAVWQHAEIHLPSMKTKQWIII